MTDRDASGQTSLMEVMLAFVRSAILGKEPQVSQAGAIDWDGLMKLAHAQGLLALVWDGICRLPEDRKPARCYRISWGMSVQDIWDRYDRQKSVLGEMVSVCRRNDMRLLLLKGIGLSEAYPNPRSRASGDLDIYLFGDFEKGNRLFGDGVNRFYKKHASFAYKGVDVENHKTPLDVETRHERAVGSYLKSHLEEACLSPMGYYTFCPLSNLIYLMMHTLHHITPRNFIPLRYCLDIAVFVDAHREQLPPQQCHEVLSQFGLDRPFALFVGIGEMAFGIGLEDYRSDILRQKDLPHIKEYVLTATPRLAVGGDGNCMGLFLRKWRQVRGVYRYLPQNKELIAWEIARYNLSVWLKAKLEIPDGVPFWKGVWSRICRK